MKTQISLSLLLAASVASAKNLDANVSINAQQMKGQTYFSLMAETIKPKLDDFATKGFVVADGQTLTDALNNVGKKVSSSALRAAGDRATLGTLGNALRGQSTTFYALPALIAKQNSSVSRYDLTTYLALASAASVAIELDAKNTFYNVNYGTGTQDKDEMTGRSFSETPLHNADDISDKSYLQGLEDLVRGRDNSSNFFNVVLQGLVNCDFSGYAKLSDLGQSVATDFFAIYTAEQDRHLMAKLQAHAWDAALLEVTLLSSLHAGQDKIALIVDGQMKDTVENQVRCGKSDGKVRAASLIDYWQFSNNPDPAQCGRSGINITKKDFRALGQAISNFERANNPQIVAAVERHFSGVRSNGNVFAELSDTLISYKAPRSMGADGQALVKDMIVFLEQVEKDANAITASIH